MSDPEVRLKFAGSSADAERAIAVLERRLQNLENAAKRVKDRGKDAAGAWEELGNGANRLTESLMGVSGPVDAIVRGIQLIKAEWDDLVNRQNAAADANRDFAKNLQAAANNSDAPLGEIKKRMLDISTTALITPSQSAKLLNIAQAAKGPLDEKKVDETIVAAAQVARLDQGAMEGLVNTSLDIQKQLGATPQQAIGFTLAAMTATRVPETEKFTKNVLPGIIGVNKLDNTSIEYATALSAGITQAAGDTEGRKSRTAMTALALQLRDAFPELKDTEARVKALQENPELRNAFLNGGEVNGRKLNKMKFDVKGPDGQVLQLDTDRASFERQMVPAIEQILTRGTFAEKMIQHSLNTVPSLQNADADFKRRVQEQAADPTLKLANREIHGEVSADNMKIRDVQGAGISIDRETVEKRLAAAGFGAMQRWLIQADASTTGWMTGDYQTAMIERLKGERKDIIDWGGVFGMSDTRRKQIESLDELIGAVEAPRPDKFNAAAPQLQVNVDKLADALDENTKATREAAAARPAVVVNRNGAVDDK